MPFTGGSDTDSTAGSLGLTYSPGNWIWHTRLDYRDNLWLLASLERVED